MEPLVVAVLIGIAAYFAVVAMIPKHILAESNYTRSMLERLERENVKEAAETHVSVFREQMEKSSLLTKIFFTLPMTKTAYPRLLKAGLEKNIDAFFMACLVALLLAFYALKGLGVVGLLIAMAFAYMFGYWYIGRRIKKRSFAFLNMFPDALDMIVRSVRSGYPLNAAVKMVADNMQPPVSNEFKQVADEIAYGSTLIEALKRLALRIDEPDVNFFVVMLTVQQEVGGNISEVLGNLASIIRKRKHLRMKIHAMTSEGRATAWVLGLLPVFEFFMIKMVSPNHLTPLFVTPMGHLILAGAIGIVLVGMFIVRIIINMEI